MLSAMNDCLFCRIARGEAPARVIFEDDEILAFHDISPKAPIHFLAVPKKHIADLMELSPEDAGLVGRLVFESQRIAAELGCSDKGARFVFNCKSDGGQTVGHLHLHVLGGRALGWPPG
jgi:histidine triad (HIT) family protein